MLNAMICILHTDQKNAVTLTKGFDSVLLQGKKRCLRCAGKEQDFSAMDISHVPNILNHKIYTRPSHQEDDGMLLCSF